MILHLQGIPARFLIEAICGSAQDRSVFHGNQADQQISTSAGLGATLPTVPTFTLSSNVSPVMLPPIAISRRFLWQQ